MEEESKMQQIKEYIESCYLLKGNKINVDYSLQCEGFLIPALTIQPIVENAVKHGILSLTGGGTVIIHSRRENRKVMITVEDNGVGFDIIEIEQNNHVGLRNIRSRLEAMCGGTLHIESIIGVGTKITIEIPKEAD